MNKTTPANDQRRQIPSQVLADRFLRSEASIPFNLNAYERVLLFILASYAGGKINCFPSHQSLSTYCGMSVDSVKRYTKSLKGKELITIIRVNGCNNTYQLNIPIVEPNAKSTGCSQPPPADSTTHPGLTATSPGADSPTNNISNNINQSTSFGHTNKMTKNHPLKKREHTLPEDMKINDRHRELASELNLNVESEFNHFKEHHLAKGSVYTRWDMAFCTWLRNASKFSSKKSTRLASDYMQGVGYE